MRHKDLIGFRVDYLHIHGQGVFSGGKGSSSMAGASHQDTASRWEANLLCCVFFFQPITYSTITCGKG